MKISIAMATYNGARYLREQLDSFVKQTKKPDEIVVCDDGSTDETMDILYKFQLSAPFDVFIYENKTNLGYKKNFEKAMGLCSGDLIYLSDQDDFWFPEKIKIMTEYFEGNENVHVLVANVIIADQNMNPSSRTQLGNHLAIGHSKENYGLGCATAVRKSLLGVLLPIPDVESGHDGWIHQVANALDVRVVLEEPVQFYRRHGSNASDSIESMPVRPTSIEFLKKYGLRDAVEGWNALLSANESVSLRLSESASILESMGLSKNVVRGHALLQNKIESINKRINLVKVDRWKRFKLVISLWLDGGYSEFSGWRSAVKDIIRRS